MRVPRVRDWPKTVEAARAEQERLRTRVELADRLGKVHYVAGVDVGFEDEGRVTRAAVAVLDFPSLAPLEQAVAREPTRFPYVPGYLSFREIPAVLAALAQLKTAPDLILCDGQGYAHPRRFGLACHLGVLLDLPTIGVAKSRLTGAPRGRLGRARGSWVPLLDAPLPAATPGPHSHSLSRREREASRGALRAHWEIIGAALRTRAGVKPLFVSTGHRVSLDTAIRLVLDSCPRYRLPETTRRAHRLASG